MGGVHSQDGKAAGELVRKRVWVILGVIVLLGVWGFVVGYEFLEKENALWQKKVKAARDDQRRCEARYSKFRNFDQFRTGIRLPYVSDLSPERWMQQFNTLRAGMSESEVQIIMGAPDYARCDVSEKGDAFVGSVWRYEIAVPQDAANDGQNSLLQIVFGPDGKMTDKNAMNMRPRSSPMPTAASTATPLATPAASPEVSGTPGASSSPVASPQQAEPAATASPTPQ